MENILKRLLELLGQQIWVIIGSIIAMAMMILALTIQQPISITFNTCVEKESTTISHNTKLTVHSIINHGLQVNVCVHEKFNKEHSDVSTQ
jgi:hypothetical protein